MEQTELNVSLRERVGKGGARSARREGLIPGLYMDRILNPAL